ncbi:hypothetical protein ACVWYF_002092 [Hymenobacter sp. UYAg731]
MPLSTQELVARLTLVPVVVAGLIGLARWRQLPANMRCLTALIGWVLPLNLLGFVFIFLHRSNLFLMPVYAVGEFMFLALVFRHTLQSPAFSRAVPWLVGGFGAYALFDSLTPGALEQFRPGQQVIQSVLVLGLVGLYFRKLLRELRVMQLRREPMLWVSAGLLIYYLGYLQIAIFSNYLLRYSQQLNSNVWMIHSLLFIVLYSCYSLALWLPRQK